MLSDEWTDGEPRGPFPWTLGLPAEAQKNETAPASERLDSLFLPSHRPDFKPAFWASGRLLRLARGLGLTGRCRDLASPEKPLLFFSTGQIDTPQGGARLRVLDESRLAYRMRERQAGRAPRFARVIIDGLVRLRRRQQSRCISDSPEPERLELSVPRLATSPS